MGAAAAKPVEQYCMCERMCTNGLCFHFNLVLFFEVENMPEARLRWLVKLNIPFSQLLSTGNWSRTSL